VEKKEDNPGRQFKPQKKQVSRGKDRLIASKVGVLKEITDQQERWTDDLRPEMTEIAGKPPDG